ncbi:hypothetical protein ROZALSC1DRAFT_28078 [Rozella allomycis CSF55]|uniref:Uncharacterized protein n=1 Tax=Rozella allomycis (strain CSF55) TaxID=988480 RepID=A0A075AMW2_ROZAC|nr:hypothetical protein O9G_001515 [Rozella allomycis CSF55]RKP20424.1 hypothetical protein ROZALSC1DRAFT_28078 [Rozella allomycis CSF55]|eukprot:EPZ31041.1 hypothetical protein O9G_001515 [Rozella allomycis CSF55]
MCPKRKRTLTIKKLFLLPIRLAIGPNNNEPIKPDTQIIETTIPHVLMGTRDILYPKVTEDNAIVITAKSNEFVILLIGTCFPINPFVLSLVELI